MLNSNMDQISSKFGKTTTLGDETVAKILTKISLTPPTVISTGSKKMGKSTLHQNKGKAPLYGPSVTSQVTARTDESAKPTPSSTSTSNIAKPHLTLNNAHYSTQSTTFHKQDMSVELNASIQFIAKASLGQVGNSIQVNGSPTNSTQTASKVGNNSIDPSTTSMEVEASNGHKPSTE